MSVPSQSPRDGPLRPVERTSEEAGVAHILKHSVACRCPSRAALGPHVSSGTQFRKDDPLHFPLEHREGQRTCRTMRPSHGFSGLGAHWQRGKQPCPVCSLTILQPPGTPHMNDGADHEAETGKETCENSGSSDKIPPGIPEVAGRQFLLEQRNNLASFTWG